MIYGYLTKEMAEAFAEEQKRLWACNYVWNEKTGRPKHNCEPVEGRLVASSGTLKFAPLTKSGRLCSNIGRSDYKIRQFADTKREAETLYQKLIAKERKTYRLPSPPKVYNRKSGHLVEHPRKVVHFLKDLEKVCKAHNMVLEADGDHFVINTYSDGLIKEFWTADLCLGPVCPDHRRESQASFAQNQARIQAILADDPETETALGEPQWWIYLDSGRSIEVTWEQDGLEPERQYFSVRLHCTDEEFENDEYHGTCGIIDQACTSDIGGRPMETQKTEAASLALLLCVGHQETVKTA